MPAPEVAAGFDYLGWFVKGGGWAAFLITLKSFKYLWENRDKKDEKADEKRDKAEERRADTCNKILTRKDALIEKVYEDYIADTNLTIKTVSMFNERSAAMIKTIDDLKERLKNAGD